MQISFRREGDVSWRHRLPPLLHLCPALLSHKVHTHTPQHLCALICIIIYYNNNPTWSEQRACMWQAAASAAHLKWQFRSNHFVLYLRGDCSNTLCCPVPHIPTLFLSSRDVHYPPSDRHCSDPAAELTPRPISSISSIFVRGESNDDNGRKAQEIKWYHTLSL